MSLYERLKGKFIKIKTWEELCNGYNTNEDISVTYHDGTGVIYFTKKMRYLCGRYLYVGEELCPKDIFEEESYCLDEEHEILYYDKNINGYWFLCDSMFEVIDLEKLEKNKMRDKLNDIIESIGDKMKASTEEDETIVYMPVKVKINEKGYISLMEDWNNTIMYKYNKYISNK